MFVEAIEQAAAYTKPVITCTRNGAGDVGAGCATYMVLNDEGWVLTAAHVVEVMRVAEAHQVERTAYEAQVAAVRGNRGLTDKQRRAALNSIHPKKDWITNYSYIWAALANVPIQISQFIGEPALDLAVGQIENFDPTWVANYPRFKRLQEEVPQGRSLCKLGFPYHDVAVRFDPAAQRFLVDSPSATFTRIPTEGILTRRMDITFTDEGGHDGRTVRFLETSSPGLRGQSGGPLFDVEGNVWGMQSRTIHVPLGFEATSRVANRDVVEHQFMNLGWGCPCLGDSALP